MLKIGLSHTRFFVGQFVKVVIKNEGFSCDHVVKRGVFEIREKQKVPPHTQKSMATNTTTFQWFCWRHQSPRVRSRKTDCGMIHRAECFNETFMTLSTYILRRQIELFFHGIVNDIYGFMSLLTIE